MSGNRKVMVICGHIGDWVLRAGGTLAKYRQAGFDVKVLALTWGQYSESSTLWNADPKPTLESVLEIRKQEGREAAAILDVEVTSLGWEDGPLDLPPERIEVIRDEIGRYQPDTILTHIPTDYIHPDHITTSNAVKVACRYIGTRRDRPYPRRERGIALYYFEPTAPAPTYTGFNPNIYVDITDVFEKKMAAVQVINRTQPTVYEYYGAMTRFRGGEANRWARGHRGTVLYAEGFVQDTPFTADLLPW